MLKLYPCLVLSQIDKNEQAVDETVRNCSMITNWWEECSEGPPLALTTEYIWDLELKPSAIDFNSNDNANNRQLTLVPPRPSNLQLLANNCSFCLWS